MRRFIWLSSAVLLIAAIGGGIYWLQQWQAAARRLAAWEEQRSENAARAVLDQPITLKGGVMGLRQFAAQVAEKTGLPVELDEEALAAQLLPDSESPFALNAIEGTFSLHAALLLHLDQLGLCADVRGKRLFITTPDRSIDRTRMVTTVYPLPQPEPGGIDEVEWTEIITSNVEPGAWDSVGGKGHVEAVPGALVVAQTAEIQRRVRLLINTLEKLDDPSPQPLILSERSPGSVEALIRWVLEQPTTTMDFVEQPLRDVTAFLTRQHRIPVVLHTQKLKDTGLSGDSPVTKTLRGISLQSALRLLLKDLDLTFIVRDEALLITTREDAESRLHGVAYPVHDLIETPNGQDLDSLIDLITTVVLPPSWSDVGGPGSVQGLGRGWLLVQQTEYCHALVDHLLTTLRGLLSKGSGLRVLALSPDSAAEQKIRLALAQPLSVDFRNAPLRDVVMYFHDALHIPILLDTKSLETTGRTPDTPIVWFTAPSARAGLILQLLLEPHDLVPVVRDEVLVLTTREEADSQLETWLFDIRPILSAGMTTERLCQLIGRSIDRNSWVERNGSGSVNHFNGILVVFQTHENLKNVKALLEALEKYVLEGRAATNPPSVAYVSAHAPDPAIEALLNRIVSVKFDKVPRTQALRELAAVHGLPLFIDPHANRLDPGDTTWEVTLDAPQMTLGGVLDRMLRPFGFDYTVREGLVWINASSWPHWPLDTRFYLIRDLAQAGEGGAAVRDALVRSMPRLGITPEFFDGPAIELVEPDWLVVRGERPFHNHVADWLVEQRSGLPPTREAERRTLESYLESMREMNRGNDPFAAPAKAKDITKEKPQ